MYVVNRSVVTNDSLAGQPLSALAPEGIGSPVNIIPSQTLPQATPLITPKLPSTQILSQRVTPQIPTEVTNIIVLEEQSHHKHHHDESCIEPQQAVCTANCQPKAVVYDTCGTHVVPAYNVWGWGWLGSIILWSIIFTVLFWLIFYSLKPPFVLQTDSNQVDTAKVLLAAVIAAIIIVGAILLIKFLINRSY